MKLIVVIESCSHAGNKIMQQLYLVNNCVFPGVFAKLVSFPQIKLVINFHSSVINHLMLGNVQQSKAVLKVYEMRVDCAQTFHFLLRPFCEGIPDTSAICAHATVIAREANCVSFFLFNFSFVYVYSIFLSFVCGK